MNKLVNSATAILLVFLGVVLLGPVINFLLKNLAHILWPGCEVISGVIPTGPYYCEDKEQKGAYTIYMFSTTIFSFLAGSVIMFVIWMKSTRLIDKYVKR